MVFRWQILQAANDAKCLKDVLQILRDEKIGEGLSEEGLHEVLRMYCDILPSAVQQDLQALKND